MEYIWKCDKYANDVERQHVLLAKRNLMWDNKYGIVYEIEKIVAKENYYG